MNHYLILHDTSLSLKRGAELTILDFLDEAKRQNLSVEVDLLHNFDETKAKIDKSNVVILCSSINCRYETNLLNFLIDNSIKYVKVEFDYNFCTRRNILCKLDTSVQSCCDPNKYHLFRNVFVNAQINFFQSPKHLQSHQDFFGEAIVNPVILPPTIAVSNLKISKEKSETIPFFGDLNYIKGGNHFIESAINHPNKKYVVYGENHLHDTIPNNVTFKNLIENSEVLEILGKTKEIIIKPNWLEPSGRLAAEAFLSGCEILTNENVGTWSFDFYPNNHSQAIKEIERTPSNFWNKIKEIQVHKTTNNYIYQNVLVYKSYGGLGDIFFTLPAIYNLKKISKNLSFAIHPRLVSFFKSQIFDFEIVDETTIKSNENNFDKVIELGNYPIFNYDYDSIPYITSNKVNQHAIQHYIDALARLHPTISNKNNGYPYFNRNTNYKSPFYTLHAGAGFLLKIWPTINYANLIIKLHNLFPNLKCKIILGKEDPNPLDFISKKYNHIELITGDLHEVGDAMSEAIFHIGNDAGITHVAGAYNTPIVGIYGPTGPGSWGCFSENNEIIWGKQDQCFLSCNYHVIMNCEHKVCLNSISVDKVVNSLYDLLGKTYLNNEYKFNLVKNPFFKYEITEKDCLLKLEKNEFLLEFKDNVTHNSLINLFENNKIDSNFKKNKELLDFIFQQKIFYKIPVFL